MPDNPESQELTSQNGEKAPKQKESLIKKTWNRMPAPARIVAGATLTLASLAGVVKGQEAISQNDEGKPNENIAERTIEPTREPTQVVEITPTPINETPTPSPTEAPTPAPAETETPQKEDSWTVQIDYAEPSHFRTLEQDQAILNSVMDKYPHLYDVQIILTSGESSATYVDPDPAKPVIVRAGRGAYDFERKLHNEFARVFNVDQPEIRARMQSYYSPEEIQQLEQLNRAVVEKWRNYPYIEKMFAPDKLGQTTKNHFTAYPDAIFLQESIKLSVPGHEWTYPLPEPIFDNEINRTLTDQLASQTPEFAEHSGDLPEFFTTYKEKLDTLRTDPIHDLALTLAYENLQWLKNWQWMSTQNINYDNRYLSYMFRDVLPSIEGDMLLSALGRDDPRLNEIFSPESLAAKKGSYQILTAEADKELFDTIYEQVLLENEQEDLINQYLAIVSTPKHKQ